MMCSSIWDKVDALESLEPSHGILSGSSDQVSEAIGSIQWCCLDLGRSRKLQQSNQTEAKSGRSWHRSALSIAELKSTGVERRLPLLELGKGIRIFLGDHLAQQNQQHQK